MKKFNCPSCGGPVESRSSVAISIVCPYCQSLLLRQDLVLEFAGEKALIIEDSSPFQIGTEGRMNKVVFTLLGRLRFKWEQGFWDEWFAWSDDGQTRWLADAQGFLSFYDQVESFNPTELKVDDWKPGDEVKISGKTWGVLDIKKVALESAIGELPLLATQNRKSLSIDLAGTGDECATVEAAPDGFRVYVGKLYDFNDFGFARLRELDGW